MRDLALLLRAPIVAGSLRGRWWCPAGGGKVWRVLGGSYETGQTARFIGHVSPGDVVLDLGAHVGYYTLLAAALTGPSGRVFSFEPNPRNARYLRHHVRINRCRNVEVVEQAVCDHSGEVRFGLGTGSGTGHIAETGAVSVRSVTLDDFCAERAVTPSVMKIDVEGAERRVLEGAAAALRSARPLIFLSTHGAEQAAACRSVLSRLGYRMTAIDDGPEPEDHLCVPEEQGASFPVAAVGEALE